MKKYECGVIYAPSVGSDVLESSAQKYTGIITAGGGSVTKVDDWGKRALAYEINHQREGYYHFYKFDGGGDIVRELNRQLRIDENVIRHMIVRDEVVVRPAADAPAEGDAAEKEGAE